MHQRCRTSNWKSSYLQSRCVSTRHQVEQGRLAFSAIAHSSLWADVVPAQSGAKPPEPFFFRANTNDCITFYHTNLVPGYYELDDFQVRTPTDIIGQHIHLVKFDVTSSDGSGNGFNYEDGTFSPDEVIERIRAIRKQNSCIGKDSGDPRDGTFTCPKAKAHPFFGTLGAQTTIQRWFADDVLNNNKIDRTLAPCLHTITLDHRLTSRAACTPVW